MTNPVFPPALNPGDTIGVFSPSSSIVTERFQAGVKILEERGYNVLIHPQTYSGSDTGDQQAGTPENKAAALMDLWLDKNVRAIFASCGGNGAVHMLPLIDWPALTGSPKILMGFSDITALLSGLYTQTHIAGYFGPTVQTLSRLENINLVFDLLGGTTSGYIISMPDVGIVQHGMAEAPVFAATLSVLLSLAGTQYFPSLEGHILVLEDIGEELSRLDRLFWQLRQVVDFSKLAGLICGDFIDLQDTGRPFGQNFDDIIRLHSTDINGPVVTGAPLGHGKRLFPLAQGQPALIDTRNTHLLLR